LVKVKAGPHEMAAGLGAYPWPGAYHVDLTEKGTAVVAAWNAGDTAALKYAQATLSGSGTFTGDATVVGAQTATNTPPPGISPSDQTN